VSGFCGEKHSANAPAIVCRIEAWRKEKEMHSVLFQLSLASLMKLSAGNVGFAGKVGTVHFHPKVAHKLSLSLGNK
jgi:hypothetical protein